MALKEISIIPCVYDRLQEYAEASGRPTQQVAEEALTRYLDEQQGVLWMSEADAPWLADTEQERCTSINRGPGIRMQSSVKRMQSLGPRLLSLGPRMQSLMPLYIAEPVISLVDGLLEGDHSVADCLAKGNFGLGTLDFLNGEIMVLDGVAWHQSEHGVKALKGDERTPFMAVTTFDRLNCKQFELEAAADVESLKSQLQGHFRSRNVVYAMQVEGSFPYVKCRAVCKQSENKRLRDVATEQALFEHTQEQGVLVGFWSPAFLGSNLNVPGFHFHYLSADKQRGGHVLEIQVDKGATTYLQEIHRVQVDLPYSQAWLDSSLKLELASAELAEAELAAVPASSSDAQAESTS